MSEKRLIAIDAETVLQLEEIAIDLDVMNHHSGDRRGFDILRSILAAWDEGITRDDRRFLIHCLKSYAEFPQIKRLIRAFSDPAPQEAE